MHRRRIAQYVAASRHLHELSGHPKTLAAIAAELGTSSSTVRRWLRRDHWSLWAEYWPQVEDLWPESLVVKSEKARREVCASPFDR